MFVKDRAGGQCFVFAMNHAMTVCIDLLTQRTKQIVQLSDYGADIAVRKLAIMEYNAKSSESNVY